VWLGRGGGKDGVGAQGRGTTFILIKKRLIDSGKLNGKAAVQNRTREGSITMV